MKLSSFIGRDLDTAALGKLLEDHRLVTVTGPAGIGKTRLAMEVAGAVVDRYRNGACFVDLAGGAHSGFVPTAVAAAFRLGEQPGHSFDRTLIEHLVTRNVLLILDNCEHLRGACGDLAEALLASCPGLSVLTTSRQALGIPGEAVYRLSPLAVPDPVSVPRAEAVLASEAVRLFCDRAAATEPDFALCPANVGAVAEICAGLEGIPLAIELAASRVGVISPAEIARRVGKPLDTLTARDSRGPTRHHSLRAALDSSHDLLTGPEQVLLWRLSVFSGGWSLEAAEGICAGVAVQTSEVWDLLAGLVAKSLVVADATNVRTRYRLLEPIRQYGREKLDEAGEGEAMAARHAAWFAALVEEAEPHLTGPNLEEWMELLRIDSQNVRAAIDCAILLGHAELALRLCGGLALFWRTRAYFSEGRQLTERALGLSDEVRTVSRAKALWGLAFLTGFLGDNSAALMAADKSLVLASELGERQLAARAAYVKGFVLSLSGAPLDALPLLEQSITVSGDIGDAWCLAGSLAAYGRAQMFRGDAPSAVPYFEECLRGASEAGDRQNMTNGLIGLGWASLAQGDYSAAERLLNRALTMAIEVGDKFAEAVVVGFLGDLARRQGRPLDARELLNEGLAVGREVRAPIPTVSCLSLLARTASDKGDYSAARLLFDEALALASRGGVKAGVARQLEGLGEVSLGLGDAAEARTLFETALQEGGSREDKQAVGRSLTELGKLADADGDHRRGASLYRQALEIQRQTGDLPALADSMEALAGSLVTQGSNMDAIRIFAAAQSLRDSKGYPRSIADGSRIKAELATALNTLSPEHFEAAWAQGVSLSPEEATSPALRGRGPRRPVSEGWEGLTRTEREVARLVAEGLTNPQIGDRLFISPRTVQSHLYRVFRKLRAKSRWDVAREASRQRP